MGREGRRQVGKGGRGEEGGGGEGRRGRGRRRGGEEGREGVTHLTFILLFSVKVTWRKLYLLWRQPSRL